MPLCRVIAGAKIVDRAAKGQQVCLVGLSREAAPRRAPSYFAAPPIEWIDVDPHPACRALCAIGESHQSVDFRWGIGDRTIQAERAELELAKTIAFALESPNRPLVSASQPQRAHAQCSP